MSILIGSVATAGNWLAEDINIDLRTSVFVILFAYGIKIFFIKAPSAIVWSYYGDFCAVIQIRDGQFGSSFSYNFVIDTNHGAEGAKETDAAQFRLLPLYSTNGEGRKALLSVWQ